MTNLTISIDDELLRAARIRAAEHGTSVNAVLRQELIRYAGAQRGADPVSEFLAIARTGPGASAPGQTWLRDELHLERFAGPSDQGKA